MKRTVTTIMFMFLLLVAVAQSPLHCSYDSIMARNLRQNPNAYNELRAFMVKAKQGSKALIPGNIREYGVKRTLGPDMAHYVIPIVVHIIHDGSALGTGSNITNEQVYNQISNLNEYFKPYGIQFCLGSKTPDSVSFNGITRRSDLLTNYRLDTDDQALMSLDLFPKDMYVNIWVVKAIHNADGSASGIVGAASNVESIKNGVVIAYEHFGDARDVCPTCNLDGSSTGMVLAHEFGHLFGLLHTHENGCNGTQISDCDTSGDFICDTPPMEYVSHQCTTSNTCTEVPSNRDMDDPISNFMSYKYQSCLTDFTNEQVKLMYFHIENYFKPVIHPDNLTFVTSGVCSNITALFKSDKTQLCGTGQSVLLTALDNGNEYKWVITKVGGGVVNSPAYSSNNYLSFSFSADGDYDVQLFVKKGNWSIDRTVSKIIKVINCGNLINSKRGNWYFGEYAGLEFRQFAAVPNRKSYTGPSLTGKRQNVNTLEGCIVQNNKNGRLLFYGGGKLASQNHDSFYIYDKNHNEMPNSPVYGTHTSSQGGITVPKPGSGNKYYLFTTNKDNRNNLPEPQFGCRFSIIDTALNSGNGDVESSNKNVPLTAPTGRPKSTFDNAVLTGEGIAAIPGCDSTSYYVFVTSIHKDSSLGKCILTYKVTASGVTHISTYWHSTNFWAYGAIVASSDGRLLSVCGLLFEVNRFTGALTFVKNLQDSPANAYSSDLYHTRFSPNSKILYLIRAIVIDPNIGNFQKQLRQYDLTTSLDNYVVTTLKENAYSLQIGPDNKMYISQFEDTKMSYIEFPDRLNTMTDNNQIVLKRDHINLVDGNIVMRSTGGLPNFIDAGPQNEIQIKVFHRITACNQVYFYTNQCCKTTYSWNFGDGNTGSGQTVSHTYSGKTGTKYVTLTLDGSIVLRDTIKFGITGTSIDGKTTVCDTNNSIQYYLNNPKPGFLTYSWSANNGNITLTNPPYTSVNVRWGQSSGYVRLIATDKYGCKDTAQKSVSYGTMISNNTISTSGTCNAVSISGSTPSGGTGPYRYKWYVQVLGGTWREDGATTKDYTPALSNTVRNYRRAVYTDNDVCQSFSNEVQISTVDQLNKIKEFYYPDDADSCYRKLKGTNIKAQYPTATVQWERSTNKVTWVNYTTSSDTMTPILSNVTPMYYYRRKVTIGACVSNSNIMDGNSIVIIKQPVVKAYCDKIKFPLEVEFKIKNVYNRFSGYQMFWEHKHINLSDLYWASIDGSNSKDSIKKIKQYHVNNDSIVDSDTFRFYVYKFGCYGFPVYSDKFVVKKIDSLLISRNPRDTSITAGNSVRFNVGVNVPQSCTFVWQDSAAGSKLWNDIAFSNNDTLIIPYTGACNSNRWYRCKIIHACKTKYSKKAKLTLTGLTSPSFDPWIKDQWTDNGSERNTDTADLVRSPDIWNRWKNDSIKVHQKIYYDQDTNWVWATVRNRGSSPTNTGKLYLYWTWAGTGEIWDKSWKYSDSNKRWNSDSLKYFPTGGEINKIPIDIPAIAPGDSLRISYPWLDVPMPTWYFPWTWGDSTIRHNTANVCFLARIQTCQAKDYGMAFKEKRNILYNAGRNNNIATKNSWVYFLDPPPGTQELTVNINNNGNVRDADVIRVGNIDDVLKKIKICVKVQDATYLTKAEFYIEMGSDLHQAWINGGSFSTGLTHIADRIYQVTSTNACIDSIEVDSGFDDGIRCYYGYKNINDRFNNTSVYPVSITQSSYVGGVTGQVWFEIRNSPFIPYASISSDSTLTTCNWNGSTDLAAYNVPYPNLPYTIRNTGFTDSFIASEPGGAHYLAAGSYMVTCTDDNYLKTYITNLTVNFVSPDTTYFTDTIRYSCNPVPNRVPFISLCENSVMLDRTGTQVEGNGNYELTLSEGYYQFICPSPEGCTINKTMISFMDSIQYPDIEYNYIEASYDRERDPCCLIDVEELHCEGNVLEAGDDIQIFNMNGEFLFSTEIEAFPADHIGFRFCQPHWNTDPSYISDWYSIVFRKDTCQFCRMDFYCDSAGHEDLVRADFKGQKSQKVYNRQHNNKASGIKRLNPKEKTRYPAQSFIQYPNPANHTVTLEWFFEGNQPFTIVVTDVLGKVVYSVEIKPESSGKYQYVIPMSDQANGTYSIQVSSAGFNHTSKVVLIK